MIRDFFKQTSIKTSDSKGKVVQPSPVASKTQTKSKEPNTRFERSEKREKSKSKQSQATEDKSSQQNQKSAKKELIKSTNSRSKVQSPAKSPMTRTPIKSQPKKEQQTYEDSLEDAEEEEVKVSTRSAAKNQTLAQNSKAQNSHGDKNAGNSQRSSHKNESNNRNDSQSRSKTPIKNQQQSNMQVPENKVNTRNSAKATPNKNQIQSQANNMIQKTKHAPPSPAKNSQKSQNVVNQNTQQKSKQPQDTFADVEMKDEDDNQETISPQIRSSQRNTRQSQSRGASQNTNIRSGQSQNAQNVANQNNHKSDVVMKQQVSEDEDEDLGAMMRNRRRGPAAVVEDEDDDQETQIQARNRQSKKRNTILDDEDEEDVRRTQTNKRQKVTENEEEEKDEKQQQQAKKSQADLYLEKMAYSKQQQQLSQSSAKQSKNMQASGMSPRLDKLSINDSNAAKSGSRQMPQTMSQKSNGNARKQQKPASQDEDMDLDLDDLRDAIEDKPLEGLTFVISGEFQIISRGRLESLLIEKGGRVTSAVSGKTDYLIVGYKLEDGREVSQGSKFVKATQLGKTILTEIQLEEFIKEKSGDQSFTISMRPGLSIAASADAKMTDEQALKASVEKKRESLAQDNQSMVGKEMWTDLYAPQSVRDLVGNQGVIDQLYEWLKDWDDVHVRGNKKQVHPRRGQSWQDLPKVNATAVLLSGPPGIGKTSSARIVCKQLGFEVLETNASDTRNKNSINNMLQVLSSNKSIDYFSVAGIKKQQANPVSSDSAGQQTKKSVIIMDEVDGVGAGDRGGLQALIQVIKLTKTPIICICNDRQNRKLQSLLNYCYDLKFNRPSQNEIAKRVQLICQSEGLQIDNNTINKIIESSGSDIRQIVNILQMWKNQQLDTGFLKNISKDENVMINNFDAAHRMLNHGAQSLDIKYPQFRQKMDLFFIDYDLIPLLIQENYLNSMGDRNKLEDIERMASAAEFISLGDSISNQVRKNQDWSLLPNMGICSAIAPCLLVKGSTFYPRFPEWLGKNSSQRKAKRLIRELKKVMGHHAQADRMEIQNEYTQLILSYLYKFLKKHEKTGDKENLHELLEFMKDLGLTMEHFKEHLISLCMDKKTCEGFDSLASTTKAAFTKMFNQENKDNLVGKKGKKAPAGKKGGASPAATAADDNGEASDVEEEAEEEVGQLIDEDQALELKKGKQLEKEMEKKNKKAKVEKFELVQIKGGAPAGGKAKKGAKKGAKTTAKAAGKKGKKGAAKDDRSEDEYISDDSLNEFVVDDDEIEYDKKGKKGGAKSAGGKGRGKK